MAFLLTVVFNLELEQSFVDTWVISDEMSAEIAEYFGKC